MFNLQLLPFVRNYLEHLQKSLEAENPKNRLSPIQFFWIGFCLMGILITNSIAWAKFERASLKAYTKQALSKMFRHSKIPWDKLLLNSVRMTLQKYGISKGVLIIDDKNLDRSKNAKKLHRLHKMRDKKTGGYFLGQNIVCLYLVTEVFCIPVSFAFYSPDPTWKAWDQENKRLKKQKVPKKDRPPKPPRSVDHPKKYELALRLVKTFSLHFPNFVVSAVLADALYGSAVFISGIEAIWPKTQVITQIRENQNIKLRNKYHSCKEYFKIYKGWNEEVLIRGRKKMEVVTGGARLYVPSHQKKRFIVALRYDGEEVYRYLIASTLSWNMKEVIQAYTLRWSIEVFFEDWSCYSGFCSMAKQCGVEGSERPLILSLLFDHCFLFHPQQQLFIKNKAPLATLGSLIERSRFDALCSLLENILESEDPKQRMKELSAMADQVFELRSSRKHMNGVKPMFESCRSAA